MNKEILLTEEHLKEKYKDKSELPTSIRLDASTLCQLKCPACARQKHSDYTEKVIGFGYLKFKDFKKFVDENNFIKNIELSNAGEIFLNPDLIKIIEYAYEKGVTLTADNGVNLNYLTDEQAEALVKYKFESIVVSIDGASQDTYQIYRVGGDYNKVLENIKKIINLKHKYKSIRPFITWKYIVFGHNEHEIPKAKEAAKELGAVELVFDANYEAPYSPVINSEFVKKESGLEHLDLNSNSLIRLQEYTEGKADWYDCAMLWNPQINWNGDVLGCCSNYKGTFGGNVFKDGLLNALNNPKLIYAKNMVMNKAPALDCIPCSLCKVYREMRNANTWITPPKNKEKEEKKRAIRKTLQKLRNKVKQQMENKTE